MTIPILLRPVIPADLPSFYEHQHDPEAAAMAAFPSREWEPFRAHWERVMQNPANLTRAIEWNGQLAGNILCWPQGDQRFVGYWIGREFWGQGVATAALKALLKEVTERPLWAYAVQHNAGSRRVLEKCGFEVVREETTEDGLIEVLYQRRD